MSDQTSDQTGEPGEAAAAHPTGAQLLQQGLFHHRRGEIALAMERYTEVLHNDPRNAEALYYCAVVACQEDQIDQGIALARRALEYGPPQARMHNLIGKALDRQGEHTEAVKSFDAAIALDPNFAEAHGNRANILALAGLTDQALAGFERALALDPMSVAEWINFGALLQELGRHEEALAIYDKALTLVPDNATVSINRANALVKLGRYTEAEAGFDEVIKRQAPPPQSAAVKGPAQKPVLAEAWLGRGNLLVDCRRYDEAAAALDMALELKPDLAEVWIGRGHILVQQKQYDAALAAYDKALALTPNLAGAWLARGHVFAQLGQYDEALPALDRALQLKPDLKYAEGYRLHVRLHLNDWTNLQPTIEHVVEGVRDNKAVISPGILCSIASTSADHLQCARCYVAGQPSFPALWRGERYSHERIRVAYLSGDFQDHAIAHLTAGLFELHDRTRFEVTGLSFGADRDSAMRHRLKSAFEHFTDIDSMSDGGVAAMMRQNEIDIVVDLMGFTQNNRSQILARRAAPIQVNYLGFPATMGAPFIDYVVADRTLIPTADQPYFAEKIVHMPDTFQATDRKSPIAEKIPTRAETHLPAKGFVFCSFNPNYKIMPDVFAGWMRILQQVDGSVLWLFAKNATSAKNLRDEAAKCGVDTRRLIFAPALPLPEHQARLGLADLFLDTFPFSAGATASGALWSGLPVLTRIGETFAGRMAASLLNAAGLPELIATSAEAYEALAIELATHPEKIAALKRKLTDNRLTTPLFDTARFTRHLEAAFTTMWQRQQNGEPPQAFAVDPVG